MTWTKLSDNFAERADLENVSRSARWLLIEAMTWCNRNLLDGRISDAGLRRCSDAEDVEALRDELVRAGIFVRADDDTGWVMDWSDQETAELVIARRAARAETQARYRERTSRHKSGDHTMCDPRFCKGSVTGNATGHETDHQQVTRHPPDPTRPDPSRPVPKGQGRGEGRGAEPASADAPPDGAQAAGARLSRQPHRWTGDCCPLPPQHPLHINAEAA